MIAALRGQVDTKLIDAVLVDVGGVIYRVNTSTTTLNEVGEHGDEVRLQTHLVVREDQLTLYGFTTDDELHLFETLIGVSGIGPKLACAILSRLTPDALTVAITAENADLLATVPGVGKRTAARLILELRGKLVPVVAVAPTPGSQTDSEVVAALRALGYTAAEAHGAVARLPRESGADAVEARVLAALRDLGEG
jgi:Holliday junction DNA helicase RuvA